MATLGKISAVELNKRLESLKKTGYIMTGDARIGEVVTVHTDPAIYHFKILQPGYGFVIVKSLQDKDFLLERTARFYGSIWDDVDVSRYPKNAPMCLTGCFVVGCYPVLKYIKGIVKLPVVRRIDLGGMKFEMPE